jgi:hypothetical protein
VKCVKNRIAAMLLILLALYGGYQLGQARAEWEYRDAVIPEGVDTDTGQTLEKAEYLKTFIQQNYLFDTTEEEMNEGMLKGLFLSLDEKGDRAIDAMMDPQIQQLAWTRHGFRTGVAGTQLNTDSFGVDGVPEQITRVMPMPDFTTMDRIIQSLQ